MAHQHANDDAKDRQEDLARDAECVSDLLAAPFDEESVEVVVHLFECGHFLRCRVEGEVVVLVLVLDEFADREEHVFEVGVAEAVRGNLKLLFLRLEILEHSREQCLTIYIIF